MRRFFSVLILALLATAGPCLAQDTKGVFRSPVLTIDQDRLFADSRFGTTLVEALEKERDALTAENRSIEAELISEEQALTLERPALSVEAFREKATAFDARVVAIRQAQDQKLRELNDRRDNAQKQFYTSALPIIAEIVRERGAVVVLESHTVILAAEQIDITEEAVLRIDAQLSSTPSPEPDVQTPQ